MRTSTKPMTELKQTVCKGLFSSLFYALTCPPFEDSHRPYILLPSKRCSLTIVKMHGGPLLISDDKGFEEFRAMGITVLHPFAEKIIDLRIRRRELNHEKNERQRIRKMINAMSRCDGPGD